MSTSMQILPFDVWMTIHGICMLLAWGIFAPCGIYIARYLRDRFQGSGGWFPYHRGCMLTTAMLSAGGSLLAFLACESHFNKPHKIIGPIVNTLMIVQMIGGAVAHAKRDPTRTVRPALNQLHRIFGGLTLLLGWTNICFGIYDHPTWPLWLKWSTLISYFLVVGVIFGRSEVLLWKRGGAQPVPAQ